MSETTRQDDPTHIPTFCSEEEGTLTIPRRRWRRRVVAFGVVTAALLVPSTAAAALVEHHPHPHLTAAVAVTAMTEDRLRASRSA